MVSREYLSFNKRERTGIITLVVLLIIITTVPKFVCNPKPVAEKLTEKQLRQLADQKINHYPERKFRGRDTVYVQKYIPSKFKHKYQYYDKPSNPRLPKSERVFGDTNHRYFTRRPGWVRPKPIPIDINIADTSAFIALPGIGSKLANRIISFRTKLGGFTTVEQIKKVYGLQDSVYQRIQPLLTCNISQLSRE